MNSLKANASKKNVRRNSCTALLVVLACCGSAFCCGGGFVPMPYIPSNTGNISTPSSKGSFFLIEKGSTTELFDVNKLQPVFRNIHMSGNERIVHAKTLAKKSDAGQTASGNARPADSASVTGTQAKTASVLNLHLIH